MLRHRIRTIVESQSGWSVIAEAQDGLDAVEQAKKTKPDIALLDISMPQLDGLEAAKQILKLLPDTQILIVTMHESDELVRDALTAGARGYILKTNAGRDLLNAVRSLDVGRPFFKSTVADTGETT